MHNSVFSAMAVQAVSCFNRTGAQKSACHHVLPAYCRAKHHVLAAVIADGKACLDCLDVRFVSKTGLTSQARLFERLTIGTCPQISLSLAVGMSCRSKSAGSPIRGLLLHLSPPVQKAFFGMEETDRAVQRPRRLLDEAGNDKDVELSCNVCYSIDLRTRDGHCVLVVSDIFLSAFERSCTD